MTRVSTIDIVIVFAYLLGMLLVGFIVKKRANKDTNNYLMANRSLPFFMVLHVYRQYVSVEAVR